MLASNEPTSLVRTKRQSIYVPYQSPRSKMRGSFYEKVMIAHRSAPCFIPSTLAHSGLRLNWLYVHVTVPTTKKGTLYDNRPKSCRLQLRYRMGQRTEPPPIFDQGISLAQRLNQQATEASRAAWAVEMRLRAVRLAETEKEKGGCHCSTHRYCASLRSRCGSGVTHVHRRKNRPRRGADSQTGKH